MESASTFATVALAATTILCQKPSLPHIEVALNRWQNSRKEIVNIYECESSSNCNTQIAFLEPGHNETSVQFSVRKNVTHIKFVPMDHSRDHLSLFLVNIQTGQECYVDISGTLGHQISETEHISCSTANKKIVWGVDNPPSHITIEIEGTIGQKWNNSQITIPKNLGMLEKIH